jgi:molybdopterin molybdotransferase
MPGSAMPAKMVSFEVARHLVEQHAAGVRPRATQTKTVELMASPGRVLAEEIVADRDFPSFARATRDGYAVRAEDVAKLPARLAIIGELKAGDWPELGVCSVGPRQAVEIMTGAPLPGGADAVVMIEHTSALEGSLHVTRAVRVGENFVPRGAEAHAGQVLIDPGRRMDYASVAIAASVGRSRVQVFRKPRVAVLSTGDELVDISSTPGPAQIRNSNSYSLAAQIQNLGAEPVQLPIASDEENQLRALIEKGLEFDLLLLTGGVSMGKYDFVEQVLGELNSEFYFSGAEIQPGRPVVFGSCAGALARAEVEYDADKRAGAPALHKNYFFGLPGNPISTMVTFELFVRPMIEAMMGMIPRPMMFLSARLRSDIKTKTGLKRFLPAMLSGEFEQVEVELVRWQGSGDIAALARANCYVVVPPDREQIEAGEWVPILLR